MEVELITIGDEILIGQTIDTNSAWMAKQLYELGIKIGQITSIKDEEEAILKALKDTEGKNSLVLITGGLGPTKDDITKKVLCKYFNTQLVRSKEVEKKIIAFFESRGREILESNLQQADLPESCTILSNELGTASGMWFKNKGTIYVSMPGVPYEMKGLMKSEVLPRIKSRFNIAKLYHRTLMTEGIGESFLVEMIKEWEGSLVELDIKIAYLPSPGMVRVRLSAEGNDFEALKVKVNNKIQELESLIPQYVFGVDDESIEQAMGNLLGQNNKTLATAESCTGGNIAKMITSVPGSSEYFMGAVVCYSNQSKIKLLEVKQTDIEANGAVSETVVRQMADGARRKLATDYAIATSGVAGPDGGTEEKPVGTVWIAVASIDGTYAKRFQFETNRKRNIIRASLAGLSMLRRLIKGQLQVN